MKRMSRLAVPLLVLVGVGAWASAREEKGGVAVPSPTEETLQIAQLPPGPPPEGGFGDREPPRPRSEAEAAKLRLEMTERLLREAGLTKKEQAAATRALEAKEKARSELSQQLVTLRRAANRSSATDQQLRAALSTYRAALARHRNTVEAQDEALFKGLSARGQVKCLSLGILENGLGGFGPGPGGPPSSTDRRQREGARK
jgi:hypothetical protein